MSDEKNRPRRSFRLLYLAPVLALVALLAWAVASPVGASPDDDFHLASIWCGAGEREGLCEATSDSATRKVPTEVFAASDCFRHEPDVSGACTRDLDGHSPDDMLETDRGNFRGNYPPVYYAVMSVFASDNVQASVIAIRAFNALLFVGIVSLLYVLLPIRRRPTLLWAAIVTAIPLSVFLIASTNPSGWAILSGGTLWLALLGYFETSGRRRIALGVLYGLLTLMAAGARGDAAIYSVFASGAVILLTMRKERGYWLQAILPIAMIAIAVVFYFSSAQSTVSTTGLGDGSAPPVDQPSPASILFNNLLNVPSLWQGVFGSWSLGWFDTPMPYVVSFGSFVVAAGVVFAGLRSQSWRKTLVLLGLGLVLVALPVYILQQSLDPVGVNVQPRYLLPLIIVFVGVAILQVDRHELRFGPVQLGVVLLALSIAFAVALHVNLRRYTVGLGNGGGWNLNDGPEWWWDMMPGPMVVWFIGSVAFAGLLVILLRELGRPTRSAAEPAPVA
ncbi:DUF2142 domain-containing protein [Agromyces sp. NPDC055520]